MLLVDSVESMMMHGLETPKYIGKIQISLKSDENDGYLARRPMYICDNMSLISS